jgi:hypothetical protein
MRQPYATEDGHAKLVGNRVKLRDDSIRKGKSVFCPFKGVFVFDFTGTRDDRPIFLRAA